MLNIFRSTKSIINAKTLQQLLDEILTPGLERMGLTKATNYSWHEQTLKEIRRGFSYNQLKGAAGTFTWGVNLDFLPIAYRNKIEYHKSAKKYAHHIFEWTNEYSNSFVGGHLQDGVTLTSVIRKQRNLLQRFLTSISKKLLIGLTLQTQLKTSLTLQKDKCHLESITTSIHQAPNMF